MYNLFILVTKTTMSSSATATRPNMSLTLAQWQQKPPNTTTSVLKSNGTIKCGSCCKSRTRGDVVVCTGKETVDIFCYSCWDGTEWSCSACKTVPAESEVVGCECCGQWVHNGCSIYIDIDDGYVCLACKTSDTTLLKNSLFNKEAELTAVASERHKLISKLACMEASSTKLEQKSNECQFKLCVSESERTDLLSEIVKLKKINSGHIQQLQNTVLASKSVKQKYDIENSALTQELHKMRASTDSVARLQQSTQFYKNKCDAKSQLLSNARTQLRKVHTTIKESQERASVAEKNLDDNIAKSVHNIAKNRKRQREHDILVDVMERIVKKSRSEWSSLPPTTLQPIEKQMWARLRCKSRALNGCIQYTASITHSRHRCPPRFNTLTELLVAVREVYTKLKTVDLSKKNLLLASK